MEVVILNVWLCSVKKCMLVLGASSDWDLEPNPKPINFKTGFQNSKPNRNSGILVRFKISVSHQDKLPISHNRLYICSMIPQLKRSQGRIHPKTLKQRKLLKKNDQLCIYNPIEKKGKLPALLWERVICCPRRSIQLHTFALTS